MDVPLQATFVSSRWGRFPIEIAEYLLSNDHIKAGSEYIIVEAVMSWLDLQRENVNESGSPDGNLILSNSLQSLIDVSGTSGYGSDSSLEGSSVIELDTPRALSEADILRILSTIRTGNLHSNYIIRTLQPHVARLGVPTEHWEDILSTEPHVPRNFVDQTRSGSVNRIAFTDRKSAKNFFALKEGRYTLTAPCHCSYLLTTGASSCFSVTLEVLDRAQPPVIIRNSQV